MDAAVLRASVHADEVIVPAWPGSGADADHWSAWLEKVWSQPAVAAAVTVASPTLAAGIDALCAAAPSTRPSLRQARRMGLSLGRYLVRMRGRATPFGLFAGVAAIRWGTEPEVRWGDRHVLRLRADAAWLATIVAGLERLPRVLDRLPVVANNLAVVRGDRLVLPWLPHGSLRGQRGPVEVSVRYTAAVRAVLQAAHRPITVGTLSRRLFGGAAEPAGRMIAELLADGFLVSGLRPPSTCEDSLGYVLRRLEEIGADGLPEAADVIGWLRLIAEQLRDPDWPWADRTSYQRLTKYMSAPMPQPVQPVMVDLRLDTQIVLPRTVAAETARTAGALVRLAPHRGGHPGWREYHHRFLDRYGPGAVVPVDLLVDPLAGTGLPRHYADPPGPAPATAPTERDRRLLALAQRATVDRAVEVVLDDDAINALAGTPSTDEPQARLLPHANLTVEVHAADRVGLAAGAFTLAVVGASRSALATNGRFLDVVAAADRRRMSHEFQQLPVGVTDALPAQLGFAPAHLRTENVVRSARLLPAMIRLAEFDGGSADEIAVDDLVVTADAGRLYLLSLSQRRVVEPVLTNAAARHAMPPLARFLAELPHATSAPVVLFDWGVADCLPFLPRVRYGRSILSAARWRIPLTAFPLGGSDRDWTALDRLRDRLRLPSTVMVGSGDRRLRLDLDDPMHRAVLRAQVAAAVEPVVVTEAATPADYGWLDGRAHEVVIPVASTLTPAPAPAVLVGGRPVRPVDRASVVLPGSAVLYAKLYAHPEVFDHLLVDQLPELLAAWEQPPMWWFLRYQDPAPHLRIRLTGLADYGLAATRVGSWATALRRRGMVADLVLDTYHPETGRYGDGPAMAAAQALFAADSRAVVAQLAALAGFRWGACLLMA